ncbi:MAG: transporter substrate-binding domain-containing protein [Pseudomonadota bacterium]
MKKLLLSLFLITISLPAWAGDAKESAFDRVMRTGVIRCGYYVFPPMTSRDPNTGTLSGFSVDFMNHLAERASLKIEWVEEVTFGNWVPALQARRFDIACTPMWPDLPQAKVAAFTHSMFYAGKYLAVMANDTRFSNKTKLADLNNERFTFVAQEGNMTFTTTKIAVPNAKLFMLAANADPGEYYQAIVSKKADAVILDTNAVQQWNINNPKNMMKLLDITHPVTYQQFPLVVGRGENDLLMFLNLAIDEMNNAGEINSLLLKWEAEPNKTYLRVTNPAKVN